MNQESIQLSTGLVNATLQYLSTKPWSEVSGLIDAIKKEAEENSKEKEDVKPQ